MSVVTLKKVSQSFKYGLRLKTLKFEISGKPPFVENFREIKQKKKEGSYVQFSQMRIRI